MVERLIEDVAAWARAQPLIRAVALVGSYARGTARPDSDVDFVILSGRPRELLDDVGWTAEFGRSRRKALEDWGRLTSVRVWYASGLEVEFGIASPDWALTPDEGTLRVVRDGLRVLLDRDDLFGKLRGR